MVGPNWHRVGCRALVRPTWFYIWVGRGTATPIGRVRPLSYSVAFPSSTSTQECVADAYRRTLCLSSAG